MSTFRWSKKVRKISENCIHSAVFNAAVNIGAIPWQQANHNALDSGWSMTKLLPDRPWNTHFVNPSIGWGNQSPRATSYPFGCPPNEHCDRRYKTMFTMFTIWYPPSSQGDLGHCQCSRWRLWDPSNLSKCYNVAISGLIYILSSKRDGSCEVAPTTPLLNKPRDIWGLAGYVHQPQLPVENEAAKMNGWWKVCLSCLIGDTILLTSL